MNRNRSRAVWTWEARHFSSFPAHPWSISKVELIFLAKACLVNKVELIGYLRRFKVLHCVLKPAFSSCGFFFFSYSFLVKGHRLIQNPVREPEPFQGSVESWKACQQIFHSAVIHIQLFTQSMELISLAISCSVNKVELIRLKPFFLLWFNNLYRFNQTGGF